MFVDRVIGERCCHCRFVTLSAEHGQVTGWGGLFGLGLSTAANETEKGGEGGCGVYGKAHTGSSEATRVTIIIIGLSP